MTLLLTDTKPETLAAGVAYKLEMPAPESLSVDDWSKPLTEAPVINDIPELTDINIILAPNGEEPEPEPEPEPEDPGIKLADGIYFQHSLCANNHLGTNPTAPKKNASSHIYKLDADAIQLFITKDSFDTLYTDHYYPFWAIVMYGTNIQSKRFKAQYKYKGTETWTDVSSFETDNNQQYIFYHYWPNDPTQSSHLNQVELAAVLAGDPVSRELDVRLVEIDTNHNVVTGGITYQFEFTYNFLKAEVMPQFQFTDDDDGVWAGTATYVEQNNS